eukprot:scaffold256739_cov31-Tisochrysis_lutea.AAC.1
MVSPSLSEASSRPPAPRREIAPHPTPVRKPPCPRVTSVIEGQGGGHKGRKDEEGAISPCVGRSSRPSSPPTQNKGSGRKARGGER